MLRTKPIKLAIAHVNDTHSHFEPTPISLAIPCLEDRVYANVGGFARIATVVNQFKQQAAESTDGFLFLHAGDCFQGTLYYSLFKGEANAVMLNQLAPDAMALGNHELDLGNAAVSKFLDQIDFPLLAGNWDVSGESPDKAFPVKGKSNLLAYNPDNLAAEVLLKPIGDQEVAIFSVALDKMADIAMPDADTPFINAKQTIINTVNYIHQHHKTPHIILLSHLGYDQDLKIAEEVEGLSLIVGGHSHVLQGDFSNLGLGDMGPYGRHINQTLVVQAGCHALALGRLEVTLNACGGIDSYSGGNVLMLGRSLAMDTSWDQSLPAETFERAKSYLLTQPNVVHCRGDESLKSVLNERYRPAVEKLKRDVVTQVPERLRHLRVPDEKGASQIAPLVCEGLMYSAEQRGHHVDFAIHNAGGVRVSLEKGKLTAAEVAGRLLPFAIDIMLYKPTGLQVKQAIEGAIDNALNNGVEGTGDGSFPYTAGLKFTYQVSKPKGERITALKYRDKTGHWSDVIMEKTYHAVSSAYTSQGKEGYDSLKHLSQPPQSIDVILSDSFIEYARSCHELVPPSEQLSIILE
ncbi:bifunctional metallophosphatase/5'-nucleotidase [Enterovibrio sp. ZSDZ35]|uniref:Bifunctional metallophosphatase/5'-nucleotidase n=1 Tax=Enterovibrio qingdaonensis TaxID=2899818 RepID=A0ABT5QFG0_9GAMM|nr:bifunctional metallophosphatase/5'-nucleotidase [Enterovibrio sp. ZSDZ35]MDD1779720.1 bifunctional metallophosphatase/5'-nucleotidase [Enterovibrio sp. ZSDZ35]